MRRSDIGADKRRYEKKSRRRRSVSDEDVDGSSSIRESVFGSVVVS
jgi:hypothetical protein